MIFVYLFLYSCIQFHTLLPSVENVTILPFVMEKLNQQHPVQTPRNSDSLIQIRIPLPTTPEWPSVQLTQLQA